MGKLTELVQSIKNQIGYLNAVMEGDTRKQLEFTEKQKAAARTKLRSERKRLSKKTQCKLGRLRFNSSRDKYSMLTVREAALKRELAFEKTVQEYLRDKDKRNKENNDGANDVIDELIKKQLQTGKLEGISK